jgi:translation initiation factor IF-2
LERVKRELMNHGIISEEFGGDAIFAPVSAKTGDGIPHLLEMILLQADVMDLRAHPDKLARGTIVEAKLDRGRGPVATVLVQEGLLKTVR